LAVGGGSPKKLGDGCFTAKITIASSSSDNNNNNNNNSKNPNTKQQQKQYQDVLLLTKDALLASRSSRL
jgi:hypothetical protein